MSIDIFAALTQGWFSTLSSVFLMKPERRFSQYRQLNGGQFLVSLREVSSSEKLLLCRSLLKENINFWQEYLAGFSSNDHMQALREELDLISVSIQEAILTPESEEVYCCSFGLVYSTEIDREN